MATAFSRDEAAEYYETYLRQVPDGDICDVLDSQLGETLVLLRTISEEKSMHRYAPDKWTIKETVGHINDTERVFTFRAFWFGRGFTEPMPSFDQNVAVPTGGSNERSWTSHIEEFRTLREATLWLFRQMPADGWRRRGIASGHPVSVRALAHITAGHVAHHLRIIRERYLP